ncbi:uncharacterized protein LOC144453508 [Glandiceps talaboti]
MDRSATRGGKVKRRQIIMNDKEIKQVNSLQSIYMNSRDRKTRHEKVLTKLEELQIKKSKEQGKEMKKKEKLHKESIERQKKQIEKIRNRYSEEQYERYVKHYVMWGGKDTVGVDRAPRRELGLPDGEEGDNEDLVYIRTSNGKRKGSESSAISYVDGPTVVPLRQRNKDKLNMILNPTYGAHNPERVLMNDVSLKEIRDAAKIVNKRKIYRQHIEIGSERNSGDSTEDEGGYVSYDGDDETSLRTDEY